MPYTTAIHSIFMLHGGVVPLCCSISDLVILFYGLLGDLYYAWVVVICILLVKRRAQYRKVGNCLLKYHDERSSDKMLMARCLGHYSFSVESWRAVAPLLVLFMSVSLECQLFHVLNYWLRFVSG